MSSEDNPNLPSLQKLAFQKWYKSYLCPENVSEESDELRMFYSQKVFHMIVNLKNAISEDNWHHVGLILAEIDYNAADIAGNNMFYAAYLNILFSFRWPDIFNVCFESILHTNTPPPEKCKMMKSMLEHFKTTSKVHPMITRNSFYMYMVACYVYALANKQYSDALDISNINAPVRMRNPEFNQLLLNCQILYGYAQILEGNDANDMRWGSFYHRVSSFVIRITDQSSVIALIEPLVVSAQKSDNLDEAAGILQELCKKTIELLPYVADILDRFDAKPLIGQMIHEVVQYPEVASSDQVLEKQMFLARFPLILYFVKNRSTDVIRVSDAELNIKILFEFLDHTTNRCYAEAWECLLKNLRVFRPLPTWLQNEWNERRDWWPKFHKNKLENDTGERHQVFDLLDGRVTVKQ